MNKFLIIHLTDTLGCAGEVACKKMIEHESEHFFQWLNTNEIVYACHDERELFFEADDDVLARGYSDTYLYKRFIEIPDNKDAMLFKLYWADELISE